VEANEWAAIGQVGSFVVAILALIFAIVSRKDSKEALFRAARSATAAEVSAKAAKDAVREAKRANELTESERNERARAELARAQHEADLVRGSIGHHVYTEIGPDRILVSALSVTVVNHGTQPAIDVMYRHMKYRPEFTLLASAIQPDGQPVADPITVEPPFETAIDNTELIPGTEIKYQVGSVAWIRRGDASPVRDDQERSTMSDTLDAATARRLVAKITASWQEMADAVVQLWQGQGWLALGYDSWDDLCAAELSLKLQLPIGARHSIVGSMTKQGMSTRAIGSALGVGKSTVQRDLEQAVPNGTPARIIGRDGNRYPPRRIEPQKIEPPHSHH
jgi:hypothetical protein